MGMGDPGIQDRDHLLSPLEEGTKKCHFPALLKLSANKLVDVLFQYSYETRLVHLNSNALDLFRQLLTSLQDHWHYKKN